MGFKIPTVGNGSRKTTAKVSQSDSAYAQLAASIIIQAFEDLRALDGLETRLICQGSVGKWEIINFLSSPWCELLLVCQNTLTQEQIVNEAWAILGE